MRKKVDKSSLTDLGKQMGWGLAGAAGGAASAALAVGVVILVGAAGQGGGGDVFCCWGSSGGGGGCGGGGTSSRPLADIDPKTVSPLLVDQQALSILDSVV